MVNIQLNLPSPIQKVELPFLEDYRVHLFCKREDLIHPVISGNKWRKLKYNIQYATNNNITALITFGGAFSNHLYAFAGACHLYDLHGIAIIRGEIDPHNPTIQFMESRGVEIISVTREIYRKRNVSEYLAHLQTNYPQAHIIPEGGSNSLGWKGVKEIMEEVLIPFDNIVLAAGTGCTAGGIISTTNSNVEVVGVLKGNFLNRDIKRWLVSKKQFQYLDMYHFGGYAKTSQELITFINQFYLDTGIPLDPIYTGKAMYAIIDRIKKGCYSPGSSILFIHTGGLQGIAGYNYRFPRELSAALQLH